MLLASCARPPASSRRRRLAPGADVAAGVRQVEEGDFEGAIVTLEAAAARLRGDPKSVRLLVQADIQLGVAHVALDHTPQAVQAFAEALALDPKLRLGADRFSPKVLRAFETAREQSARQTATGSGRSSGRTALLVGGGVAVAAGAVADRARAAGARRRPSPAPASARPSSSARTGPSTCRCRSGSWSRPPTRRASR